jgi:hypothetical protein
MRAARPKHLRAALRIVAALALAWIPTAGLAAEDETRRLVRFELPEGWELTSERHGLRHRRKDSSERTTLSVRARSDQEALDLETLQGKRRSQVRSQSRVIDKDEVGEKNGFTVWEFLVRPSPNGRGPVAHAIHLLRPDLHVEIMLVTKPSLHELREADLRTLARSVKARQAEKK